MHKLHKFSPAVCKKLGHYVYMYVDPRSKQPFYVGKGQGNRAFAHLANSSESEKASVLDELAKLGMRPIIELLKYGLTEDEALLVEATAIDLLDIRTLTNCVRGHGSRYGGRGPVDEIASRLGSREATIDKPAVLINVTQELPHDVSVQELYDATRSAWVVKEDRCQGARLAVCVYRRVIREVYEIAKWLPGGTTLRVTDSNGQRLPEPGRWEFVGRVADDEIRQKLVGRSVANHFPHGAQNPIKYVNC
jgi:uncharacterized protein